jgi:hypothetical protein
MSIETALLLTESILLLVTIVLVVFSIREGRKRDFLITKVDRATRTLTRMEYFLTAVDAMADAKEEIVGYITGRKPVGDDIKRVSSFARAIHRATKKGIIVRYMLPKFQDRLHVGLLYTKAGAEVRYGKLQIVHSMRFMIVDNNLVILAVPESKDDREITRKGYNIPSESLAKILKSNFDSCWKKGITLPDYVKETIEQTGVTIDNLASELELKPRDLKSSLK